MDRTEEEVIEELRDMGISLRRICQVLEVGRGRFYRRRDESVKERPVQVVDEELADQMAQILGDPRFPGYGYRRVWAILRFDQKVPVSKKKVQRIMKLKGWQAKPIRRPRRCGGEPYRREQVVVNPSERVRVDYPDLRWGTDLTKFYTQEDGWVNLIPVLDYCTTEVLGYCTSRRGRAEEAVAALEDSVIGRFGSFDNVPEDLSIRSDNGSIFLAKKYWRVAKKLGIRREYTPYRCASANGIVERFMRTIKEECIWQHRFTNIEEAERIISEWIAFYNNERRHSGLGYMTPVQYRESLRKLAA